MKICCVISSLRVGGAERVLSTLAGAWFDRGHRVAIVTLDRVTNDFYQTRPGIRRVGLDALGASKGPADGVGATLRRIHRLRRVLRSEDPDVVVAFGDQTNVLVVAAARSLGLPVVVSERTFPPRHLIGRLWSLSRRLAYPLADAVVVPAAGLGVWARRRFGSDRVEVIPNPVGRGFRPASDGVRRPVVVGVGRLHPAKGFDLLVRAFSRARSGLSGWRLEIVGEGPQAADLDRLAGLLLDPGSFVLRGCVERPEEVLGSAAIFALASRYEGFPNVLLEAMACGCAVVATDCPTGPAEIVHDGVNGLLVPVDDAAALAGALSRLMRNEEERRRLAAAATEVSDRFDLERIAGRWEDLMRRFAPAGPSLGAGFDPSTARRPGVARETRRSARVRPPRSPSPRAGQSGVANPRILFLIRSLERGGTERHLVSLASGLRSLGWETGVAVLYGGGVLERELRSAGVEVFDLRKRGRWDPLPLFRLVAVARLRRPSHVHGLLLGPNLLAALLGPLLPGARVVWGVRASALPMSERDWLGRLAFRASRLLARRADLIIANSEAAARFHREAGYPRETVVVVENGIDTGRFRPDRAAGRRLRAAWGIGKGEWLVGVVARLDPGKGHDAFLEAMARLGGELPELRAVCVGQGPSAYTSSLRNRCRALGLDGRVIWTGERGDMPSVYNALDLACLPSREEGFPNAVGEAMACGVPCVVTDVGDVARLVGETGCVVPSSDPAALASGIALVCRARAAYPGEACRRRIEARFGLSRMVARTAAILASHGCSPQGGDGVG